MISKSESHYWCWQCGFRFTVQPQDGKILCPHCGLHVTMADAKLWQEGTAWCPTCQLFYGIIEEVGREPECPACHRLPNGERPRHERGQSPGTSPEKEVS